MKKAVLTTAILLAYIITYCQWVQKTDFEGSARQGAVGFSIGSRGYIGTGYSGYNDRFYKDFWEYDPATDTWAQKADFGGTTRYNAVGFSIGSKGYIGTGLDGTYYNHIKDFWEFDPASNTWTRKADFGGIARDDAVGFSIGSKGYVGTGTYGIVLKDFWEYDPSTDTWTQKADFGGNARDGAVGFSIGNKGYVGTGGFYSKDFWEYDPINNIWTQKADFGGTARNDALGFSIGSKGYVGTGLDNHRQPPKDFWEYDPASNIWTRKIDLETARYAAIGFSIGGKGFIGTGSSANGDLKDFWEYTPDADSTCTAPTNLSVPKIAVRGAVLQWTLPVYAVSTFQIRYHKAGDSVITSMHTGGRNARFVLAPLSPNTTYEWQIRSNCTADTTNWVSGPDFTTLIPSAISSNTYSEKDALSESNVTVQIIPNPSKGHFSLQMQLPAKPASTVFLLYNNYGEKVWQQDAGMLSGYVNRNVELDKKLPAGVYTLIIQQNGTRLAQKLVINK